MIGDEEKEELDMKKREDKGEKEERVMWWVKYGELQGDVR